MSHIPVLYHEVLEGLNLQLGQTIVDGTLGAGGHSKGILEKIGEQGRLFAFDADLMAIQLVKQHFSENKQIVFCNNNFAEMKSVLAGLNVGAVNGVLLDIGVSSMQIDSATRGFSFRDEKDSPLDMRMNTSCGLSAKAYLQHVNKKELESVIQEFGEERYYKRIAEAICVARTKSPIETTKDLATIVRQAIPGPKGSIDKATRTFQAIRIKINNELGVLKDVIPEAVSLLTSGGRLAIITFHSLEDRIVKWSFREMEAHGLGKILTKKPIIASDQEMKENARSRSAKLRILEKI